MEALFYIGQRVVARRTHRKGHYRKGDYFVVLGIKKQCCEIGIKIFETPGGCHVRCSKCGEVKQDDAPYFDQNDFAPIQEIGNMTFEEAIKFVEPKTVKH